MGIAYTKFNNLIPYPGTKLYNEVKNSGRMNVQPHWSNFNSTLTATRSIFNITPLPYIPEGTTEWELKKDIFNCNMSWYFHPRMVWKLFLRKEKGPGFVHLPPGWWRRPREVLELAKIATVMFSNYAITLLPDFLGRAIYYGVTGLLKKIRRPDFRDYHYPDQVIDGTMRKVVIEKKPATL
jgi:hypothetical protein